MGKATPTEFEMPLENLRLVRVRLGGVDFGVDDLEPLGNGRYRLAPYKMGMVDTSLPINEMATFDIESV